MATKSMLKQFVKDAPFGLSILIVALALGIFALIAPIGGKKTFIVRSGSMQPAIAVGDLISATPQKTYSIGDVIAFKDSAKSQVTVTHRIVSKDTEGGEVFYETKGDSNKDADMNVVPQKDVLGRVDYSVQGAGRIFAFAKTKAGFFALITFPALLVMVLEIGNIIKEVRGKRSTHVHPRGGSVLVHLYHHYGRPMGVPHPSSSIKGLLNVILERSDRISNKFSLHSNNIPISLKVFLPIVAVVLVIGTTYAFYGETEISTGNSFQAANSFASPSPTPSTSPSPSPSPTPAPITDHLVINEVMFDPPNTNACGSENDAEWVEIYNPTSNPVNLDTWSVGDGNFTDDLPNVSLLAGGFAVVSDCTQSSFTSIWALPGGTIYIDLSSAIGNGLNNGGEHMRLFNGATLIDDMSYGSNTDAFSPSVPAPVADHSIERNPDGVDTNTAADWVDRTTPTPGT